MGFLKRNIGCFCLVLVVALTQVSLAETATLEHFKMLSTVEYSSGQGQFTSQVETLFTVEKKPFMDGAFANYLISTTDFNLVPKEQSSNGLSFVIERSTSKMSKANKDLLLHQQVNNLCVASLTKITKDNVGKTWKQSFDLPLFLKTLPKKLDFTVSAIEVKTDAYGKMIAVRAMSSPFKTLVNEDDGSKDEIKSKINVVYLFDSEMESIYFSMSALEAITKLGGSKEALRNEVATY